MIEGRGSTGARARLVAGAAALGVGVLGVGALAGCDASASRGSGTNYVAGDGTIVLVPPARRTQPVTLTGTTLDGTPFDLASYRGRTVVLNVWGSWCPPCRKEAPDLQAASLALRDRQVAFVGINVREADRAQAKAFETTFGITYPSIDDHDSQSLLALRGAVPANAIPSTLVIDTQGRVAARISSATTRTTLVDLVQDVIDGKDTP